MRGLNDIKISADGTTVTAGAGAAYIDAARKLEAAGLQFEVNTEIGNFTFGSAAVAGSKDASMIDPETGELRPGQVSAFVTRIQLVDARGTIREVTKEQELRDLRSSYGLLGIVTEVTMRVKPIAPISVEHRSYSLEQFVDEFPKLARYERRSMFTYMFPFRNRIVVEFRGETGASGKGSRWPWVIRNLCWSKINPMVARILEKWPEPISRYWIIDRWNEATACAPGPPAGRAFHIASRANPELPPPRRARPIYVHLLGIP